MQFFWSCLPVFAQMENRGVINKPLSPMTSEKRLALVIGNSNYQFTDKLKNPVNDATDIAATLKNLGFEVISGTDLTLPQMRKLVREFGIKLQQEKSIGLFYYAGHGVQVGGSNYLIPVDANIETAVETSDYSLDSELVLRYMREAGNEFNIVILDACRNNPFARTWRQYSSNRSLDDDKGLAKVTPPSGTIILYSTEPGKVSSDGNERNGLFTESFLSQINKPNLEFDSLVKLIARDVKQKSGGKQSPWKEGLYDGDFYFFRVLNDVESNSRVRSEQETKENSSINRIRTGGNVRFLTSGQKYRIKGTVFSIDKTMLTIMDKVNVYTRVSIPAITKTKNKKMFDALKLGTLVSIEGRGESNGNLGITKIEIVK